MLPEEVYIGQGICSYCSRIVDKHPLLVLIYVGDLKMTLTYVTFDYMLEYISVIVLYSTPSWCGNGVVCPSSIFSTMDIIGNVSRKGPREEILPQDPIMTK